VGRLELQQAFVTLDDIMHAARRSLRAVPPDDLPGLVEAAVQESILLKDLRTFLDRQSATFEERWVYRTNPRHPLVRRTLVDADE